MGYLKDTAKNFGWMGSFRILTRGVAFVRTAILARILTPSEFGVYGIVLIFLALLELLTETGVNIFLIQEDEDIDSYINTAWVVSIFRGFVISILLFIAAPYIGKFYSSPDVVYLLYIIALSPLIKAFINPSEVKLQKELKFNKEFILRTSVFVLDSIVSVGLALILKSAMALALGLVAGAILEVILSFVMTKPWPKLKFEKEKIKKVIQRGKWMTLAGVFDYLAKQGDNMVVGKVLGTTSLGFYQMAYTFSTIPVTEVSEVAGKVTFPVYTRIGGDKKRLRRAYLISLAATTILVFPVALLMYVFPKQIISIVLGTKWIDAAAALPILAIFGFIRAVSSTYSAVFLGIKKQHIVTLVTIIRFLGLAVFVIPLTLKYGIYGTSIAALISSLVPLPIIIYNLAKELR